MKIVLIIVAAAITLIAAAPTDPMVEEVALEEEPKPIVILVDERQHPEGGAYSFTMETENGIMQSEVGTPGSAGQSNVKGKYRYKLDDDTMVEVTYVADELGFQVDTPLLPVAPEFPHPIPQFVLDQIAFAEEQRRLLAIRLAEEAKLKAEEEAKLEEKSEVPKKAMEEKKTITQ
ncbi:hypothetical protein Pmani_023818 [Petrolisthes manimaculis]|uniref:Uncharacterized protein n=1 Tax=Petrolisthes manimaculis TaxID=1843537 RepID=A0AAE1PAY1_9EUCA|nr:hypothetical protein Pmani_023818 [Petrolisthes manimaculis]